ncbi:MAG: dihydroxyacetone kinase subunit L [Bryobacteraceae bacterium]|nr:dihydroxyacetone kinase subunit L [Bryobacteraceae bacterium]
MAVGREEVAAWLEALAAAYEENRGWLTQLDSAIGDADHGANMDRGFRAVRAELARATGHDIAALLKQTAAILIKTVGGASGPLYGTFFLRAGAACAGKTALEPDDVARAFEAGVEGVRQRGKAEVGDKTMVDALAPALIAMREALAKGGDLGAALAAAAAAAESGMRSTVPLQARKGRASYLGPRSVGHQDPGATSAWLLLRAAADAWGGKRAG